MLSVGMTLLLLHVAQYEFLHVFDTTSLRRRKGISISWPEPRLKIDLNLIAPTYLLRSARTSTHDRISPSFAPAPAPLSDLFLRSGLCRPKINVLPGNCSQQEVLCFYTTLFVFLTSGELRSCSFAFALFCETLVATANKAVDDAIFV